MKFQSQLCNRDLDPNLDECFGRNERRGGTESTSADDSLTSHVRFWARLRCEARVRPRTTRLEHVACVAFGHGCGRADSLVNVIERVVEYTQKGPI